MRAKQHLAAITRIVFLAITVVLQAGILVGMYYFFNRKIAYFYVICTIISFFVVLYILREDTNPTYKIPWIILNLLLPGFGGIIYLMFGRVRFSRYEKARTKKLSRVSVETLHNRPMAKIAPPKEMKTQTEYLRRNAGAPLYTNTEVTYYPLGEDFFAALVPELEKAEHFIFLEYFIIDSGKMWDTVEEILVRKAAQGVDVRLMYDDIGCIGMLPGNFDKLMEKQGIACRTFNRFQNVFSSRFNNRDHRKICVIDGNVGFTGGINLADEYINEYPKHGHWKDTAIKLRGDAVFSLTVMFLSLWDHEVDKVEDMNKYLPTEKVEAGGYVQPYCDMPGDTEYVAETVYRNMINRADRYVYITTPYLIIDNEMINALATAAKSGVDVRIITPGIPDKKVTYMLTRSYYAVLLRAGVKIYEYTPGFIHAKGFVSDDRCAVVGTINLDYRSLCHHVECAAWMCDVPAVGEIKADFLETQKKCREITPEICRAFIKHPALISILRLFAPLF